MAHYLLSYEIAPDYLARRDAFREPHLKYAWAAAERGELLLGGAVGDPADSALLLFEADHAAVAEAFARADAYVVEGLVTSCRVRPWATVVGETAATPVRRS